MRFRNDHMYYRPCYSDIYFVTELRFYVKLNDGKKLYFGFDNNHHIKYSEDIKEAAVYIGDSEVDFMTAQNAGLDVIMVDWGFRDESTLVMMGADLIAHSMDEVYEAITGRSNMGDRT